MNEYDNVLLLSIWERETEPYPWVFPCACNYWWERNHHFFFLWADQSSGFIYMSSCVVSLKLFEANFYDQLNTFQKKKNIW